LRPLPFFKHADEFSKAFFLAPDQPAVRLKAELGQFSQSFDYLVALGLKVNLKMPALNNDTIDLGSCEKRGILLYGVARRQSSNGLGSTPATQCTR
jgi:hypothetical protein